MKPISLIAIDVNAKALYSEIYYEENLALGVFLVGWA